MNATYGVKNPWRPDPPMPTGEPWGVKLGQKYRVSAECLHTSSGGRVRVVGTVAWIHPEGRFAMLCCKGPRGVNLVECYGPMELRPENRVK